MKLERLHEYVIPTVAIVFAIFVAIYCGKLSGEGATMGIVKIVAGVIAIVLGLRLRERIWLLILVCSGVGGKVPALPFTPGELAMLLAFGWTIVLMAVKVIRTKATYTLIDFVLFANLIYVVTAFIRHPAGVDFLGSERVGGRPYFATIIAFLGYWTLRRANLSGRDAWRYPLYASFGAFFSTLCGAVGYFLPGLGTALGKLYDGFLPLDNGLSSGSEPVSRLGFTTAAGSTGVNILCSYVEPVTLINPLYFWRFLLTGLSFALILLSGFRGAIMGTVAFLCLAAYFRRGMMDLLKIATIGGLALALLILLQGRAGIELPEAAQRALSFLPGNWDTAAKVDAEGSTEWRVMMWRAMLTERKYLDNPWLGDGFGFTSAQLREMENTDDPQENFLIAGVVHSGPISAIKFVGYIGLGLFLILMMTMAIESLGLMRRARGTPYFPAAIFLGVSLVYSPFGYIFIFGAYDSALPWAVVSVGFLDLIKRGLAAHLSAQTVARESVKEGLEKV